MNDAAALLAESDEPGHTVLIVDDSPVNLGVVVEGLERHGFEVLVALDGEEALQRAETFVPDLILLDIMMPGADGFEVCRRLKAQARTRDIPVIFMTSLDGVRDKVAGFGVGAVDYVTKPLQIDEVRARVGVHLQLHALQRQLERKNAALQREVAERKLAQMHLHKREQEFRALAENAPDIIVRYDLEHRRIYVNAAYEIANRVQKEFVLGRTVLEVAVFPAAVAQDFMAMLDRVTNAGVAAELSMTWERADAGTVSYYLRAVPEFDKDGRVASVLTVARDITALKETERHLRESRAMLQELAARREEAREDERRRIARDLHEELGQLLTALRMNISTLPLQYGGVLPALRERSHDMLGLVDQAITGMRAVVSALRPTTLDAGLGVGLEWLAREFSRHAGIDCGVALPDGGIDVADGHATAAFRIVQEALTNAARHAGASRIDILVERTAAGWHLKVRDNGRGFEPAARREASFGILGMEERALAIGATLVVASAPGCGTLVELRFPARQRTAAMNPRREE